MIPAQPFPSGARGRRLALFVGLVVLCLAVVFAFRLVMASGAGGRWVLPLDDAYIHQQYARQAARGLFMRYNDQDIPSSGATSLVYPLILALFWRLGAQGDALSAAAFWLGALSLPVGVWLSARLTRALLPARASAWGPLLGGALYLANGALLFGHLSGMESGMLLIGLLAYALALLEDRPTGSMLWGAWVAVLRPEGLLLVLVGGAWQLARAWGNLRPGALARLGLPIVLGLVQPLLNLALTGSLTANGMRVKGWLYGAALWEGLGSVLGTFGRLLWTISTGLHADQVWSGLAQHPAQVTLYLPPALGTLALAWLARRAWREWRPGAGVAWRPGAGMLMAGLILAVLSANALMMTAEWHLYRYVLPAMALLLPAGAAWLGSMASERGKGFTARLSRAVALCWLLASIASVPGFLWRYGHAVETTYRQQIALGEWIRSNLPEDARIAVHDAGAIRYYGERATYDMLGLTAPAAVSEAWRAGAGALYETMVSQPVPPTHLATYDDVAHFPYLASAGVLGRELYRVTHPDPGGMAAASASQAVYVADWSTAAASALPAQADVLEATAGLDLVDRVDVADPASEAAHAYGRETTPGLEAGLTEVHRLRGALAPHEELVDAGRMISGAEHFQLATRPGEDLLLIGRFRGTDDIYLDVRVDGSPAGELAYWRYEGVWQERAIWIQGALVTGTRTTILVTPPGSGDAVRWHRPYHWWAYQGQILPPVARHPVDRANAEGIRLVGYDVAVVVAGEQSTLTLDLVWQADRATNRDMITFIHWVSVDDTMLAQVDSRPGAGTRPTWSWQPGLAFADRHQLDTQADPSGSVIYVGLYDALTMDPVPLEGADGAGRVRLESVRPESAP